MKFILVTGVSTGIGYDLSKEFISKGYHVFGSVRKQPDADRVKKELGDQFTPLLFDVTDHAAIKSSVKLVEEMVGEQGLAGLVNNAGIALSGPTQVLPVDVFRKQFEVNFFGAIAVTQNFLHLLGARENCPYKPGKILNISSVAGKIAMPYMGPYSASKHAMEGWSHALRRELMIFGIDVIIIGPGAIKTPIWTKADNPPPELIDSPYGKGMKNLRKEFFKQEAQAMESDTLARKILDLFESSKPKTRYTFLNGKFMNYILPRFLPDRVLDGFVKKMLSK